MDTQLMYLLDPFKLEFEARVVERKELGEQQYGLILDKTYFYPTGGGQEHDMGTIGEAHVLDVYKDQEGAVIHVVDRFLDIKLYGAQIDKDRRYSNMQHHSAQHVLTHAFQSSLGLDTVSVKISSDTPSTIDVNTREIQECNLAKVESLSNQIVFDNIEIKSYLVPQDKIETIPFRKPPSVRDMVRVIEIDSLDYSACGGTHCARTGMIGLIKIIKTERVTDKLRVHFVAGKQALKYLQNYQNLVNAVARILSTRPDMIVDALVQQAEFLRTTQKELRELRLDMAPIEAQRLLDTAMEFNGRRLVFASFRNRSINELRSIGVILKETPSVIGFLAGYDGEKFTLVVASSKNSGVNADYLLNKHLAEINGRGGGDAEIAQGGGQISEAQFNNIFSNTRNHLQDCSN